MPTIRQRLANVLLGDELARLHNGIEALAELRHYVRSPGATAEQFSEMDSHLMGMILEQSGYTRLNGSGSYGSLEQIFSESMRQRTVTDSRWLFHYDVMVSGAAKILTDFGFGQHVIVTPADPVLAEVFKEFWTARRNRPVLGDAQIHENSEREIIDGEMFFSVWVDTLDGLPTVRRSNTDRIADIICDPDDPETPLWYVERTARGNLYYADWRASEAQLDRRRTNIDGALLIPEDARMADKLRENTRVVIVPAQWNRIGKRGWPTLRQMLVWARAYKEFIGDRATVAKKAAMRVETLTLKNSGQRQIDNAVARIQSTLVNSGEGMDRNQNTTAGQTWVQNEQANLQWMSRDTGASGAQIDGLTIAGQAAAGAGVPLHWLGRADAMQNRAVAKESSLPFYEQVQRYQTFWISVFSDLAEVVGRFSNEYGDKAEIKDFSCEVSMDSPFSNDVDEIGTIMGAIGAATQGGQIPREQAAPAMMALVRLALQSLGIRNTDKVLVPVDAPADTGGDEASGLPEIYAEALRLAESVNEVLREYDDVLTRWGMDVLRGTMDKIDYRRAHKAALDDFGKRAYEEALREGGIDPSDMDDSDTQRLAGWTSEQRAHVNGYADWLVSEDADGKRNTEAKRREMAEHIDLWGASLRNLSQLAEAAQSNPPLTMKRRPGAPRSKDPCDVCGELEGQTHRFEWWAGKNPERVDYTKRNGNDAYPCGHWDEACFHSLFHAKTGDMVIA